MHFLPKMSLQAKNLPKLLIIWFQGFMVLCWICSNDLYWAYIDILSSSSCFLIPNIFMYAQNWQNWVTLEVLGFQGISVLFCFGPNALSQATVEFPSSSTFYLLPKRIQNKGCPQFYTILIPNVSSQDQNQPNLPHSRDFRVQVFMVQFFVETSIQILDALAELFPTIGHSPELYIKCLRNRWGSTYRHIDIHYSFIYKDSTQENAKVFYSHQIFTFL